MSERNFNIKNTIYGDWEHKRIANRIELRYHKAGGTIVITVAKKEHQTKWIKRLSNFNYKNSEFIVAIAQNITTVWEPDELWGMGAAIQWALEQLGWCVTRKI